MTTRHQVLMVFREVFQSPKLELHINMVTGDLPHWDSFKNVEILLACEAKFGIRFRSKEIDAIRSIGDLMTLCEHKLAAK
jgi:acyl carrier protein